MLSFGFWVTVFLTTFRISGENNFQQAYWSRIMSYSSNELQLNDSSINDEEE